MTAHNLLSPHLERQAAKMAARSRRKRMAVISIAVFLSVVGATSAFASTQVPAEQPAPSNVGKFKLAMERTASGALDLPINIASNVQYIGSVLTAPLDALSTNLSDNLIFAARGFLVDVPDYALVNVTHHHSFLAMSAVPQVLGVTTQIKPTGGLATYTPNSANPSVTTLSVSTTAAVQGPQGPVGPQGPPGPSGLTPGFSGPNGIVQNGNGETTSVIGGTPIISYIPVSPNQSFTGGSLAGFTNLSGQNVVANTENVTGNLTVQGSSSFGSGAFSGPLSAATSTLSSLTVSGPATFSGSTTIAGLTVTGFNPGLTLGSVAFQGAAGLSQDNANFFYDSTNHRLGIGTTSPTAALDVTGSVAAYQLKLTSVGANTSKIMTVEATESTGPTQSGLLQLWSNSTSNIVLNALPLSSSYFNAGNVGIGTTTPIRTFQVVGTNDVMRLTNNNVSGFLDQEIEAGSGNIVGRLYGFGSTYPTSGRLLANSLLLEATQTAGLGLSSASVAPINFYTNATQRMTINATGNVGIGTTAPSSLLFVQNTATSNTSTLLTVASSTGASLFNVLAGGNVGIGTSSPAVALQVASGNLEIGTSATYAATSGLSLNQNQNSSNYVFGISMQGAYSSSGSAAYGMWINPTLTARDGSSDIFVSTGGVVNVSTASTTFIASGMLIESLVKTGSGTLSNAYGLYIRDQTIGNFNYGIQTFQNASSTCATCSYAISATGTAPSYFGGNVGIGTTTPTLGPLTMGSGAYVSAGGVWTNASDRNLKENFATLSPASILEKIDQLPVTQWDYKSEGPTVNHIGPVAQDFWAAFHLGNSQTSISTIDPAGVALLGIQALDQKITALQGSLSANATTTGQLTVYSPSNFSGDSVGEAKILAGQSSVRVSSSQPYEYQPIVTLTPEDQTATGEFVTDRDASGFTIRVPTPVTSDTTFAWHSFASAAEQLTVSDGTTAPIVLIVPATPPAAEVQSAGISPDDNGSPSSTPDSSASSTPTTDSGSSTPSVIETASSSPSTTPTPTSVVPTPTPSPAAPNDSQSASTTPTSNTTP